ncbi:alpha/beta fold hydrolase [Nakamurella antarctica]|uniref:Alpha/beta fold hydrolase n=2 Tax=Nakamurella antarctica TaxID=1902245 RepID=A0A3G8ZPY9_9ACTN|nr:alpha/beta fold hydrolase [Nakamurella antarctica]
MEVPHVTSTELDGEKLAFVDVGSGPALLLVHGLMSSHEAWLPQIEAFSKRYRVIAPDLFGHGASAKPLGDYSLGAHAATLRDLLAHLGIDSATIIGHSWGGGIVMQFAYLFPALTARVVLVSSGGLGLELNAALRAATLPGSELIIPIVASTPVRHSVDFALKAWAWTGLPSLSPGSLLAWQSLSTLADGETRRAFLASSRAVIDVSGQRVTAVNKLPGLATMPVLLVWGRRDRMIPSTHADSLAAALPHAKVSVFPRSGHFPQLDEPDRFNRVLDEFLQETLLQRSDPQADSR